MERSQNKRSLKIIQLTSRTIASDWILQIPAERQKLKEKWAIVANDARMDYLVRDIYKGFKGNTIRITLNVEYMPIVGFFFKVFYVIIEDSAL